MEKKWTCLDCQVEWINDSQCWCCGKRGKVIPVRTIKQEIIIPVGWI